MKDKKLRKMLIESGIIYDAARAYCSSKPVLLLSAKFKKMIIAYKTIDALLNYLDLEYISEKMINGTVQKKK